MTTLIHSVSTFLRIFFRRFLRLKRNIVSSQFELLLSFLLTSLVFNKMVTQSWGVNYLPFALAGSVCIIALKISFESSAMMLYFMVADRSIRSILVTPASTFALWISLIIANFLRLLVTLTPLTIVASYLITGGLFGSWLAFIKALAILSSVVFIGTSIGIIEGIRAKNTQDIGAITTPLFTLMSYFSGGFFFLGSVANTWILRIVKFNPMYYVVQAMRYYIDSGTSEIAIKGSVKATKTILLYTPGILFWLIIITIAILVMLLSFNLLSQRKYILFKA